MSKLEKYTDEELFDIFGADIEEEIKSRGYEYGWHKKVKYAGEIYILVNPAFPDLVKIGYADNVEKRVKTLNSNSGLPDPYHVYATYKVKKRLEDLKLHKLIDSLDSDLRHAKNKEFYDMTPEKAYGVLSAIAEINGDEDLLMLNPLDDDFFRPHSLTLPEVNLPENKMNNKIPDGTYTFVRNKTSDNRLICATAIVTSGKWTLLKGSDIGITEDKGVSKKASNARALMKISSDGKLLEDFELGVCTPSHAGTVVTNMATDGWIRWFNKDGEKIDIYRNDE